MLSNLKKIRKQKGYTQTRLAKAVGVTYTTICYIEGGQRKPSLQLLIKIATELGCTLDQLLTTT